MRAKRVFWVDYHSAADSKYLQFLFSYAVFSNRIEKIVLNTWLQECLENCEETVKDLGKESDTGI